MRTVPGTQRQRSWWSVLTLALGLALVAGCSSDETIAPPQPGGGGDDREAAAGAVISSLQSALRSADANAAGANGLGAAKASLSAAAANVRTLGLTDISLRFVDDRAPEPEDLTAFGPDAWRGVVEVRYRLSRWDSAEARVETPFVFAPGGGDGGDGQRIAAVGGADGRTPLWLRGPVTATDLGRALVISRVTTGRNYPPLARRAVADVNKVLPDWRGTLVLEVPATEQELDEVLDADQEQYANIAAVTAAVDGSLATGAPVHVFLNPRVFDALGPRGAQVVLSHETTHVATEATFSAMPTWLSEGFADYVALAHAGIPVGTAASQILARVRKNGPPTRLPTAEDLSPTANNLGATYEEAWLATRFIARSNGEAKLIAFYRSVDDGTAVGSAFRSVLNTTEAAFVKRWSADVAALAGGEPG